MANANIALIQTTNTFDEWRIAHNNLTNSINELRNVTYYKDGGSLYLGNGSIVISGTLATLLSVSGNASISQRLTSSNLVASTLLINGNLDAATFASPNVLVYVANTTLSKNLISNAYSTLNVLSVSGNAIFSHANIDFSAVDNYIKIANTAAAKNLIANVAIETAKLNVSSNAIFSGANIWFNNAGATINIANMLITKDLNVTGNANIAGQVNLTGNTVLGNVTIQGLFVSEGSSVSTDSSLILRYGSISDGTGQIVVVRTPSIGNAELRFDHTTGRWKATANSSNANAWLTIGSTEGDQNLANSQLMNATLRAYREYMTNTTITGNTTIDLGLSNYYRIRLAANANLTFSNAAAAGNVSTVTLVLVQSANGGNVVSFTNTVNWSDGQTPVLTTLPNKLDVIQIVTMDGGSRFIGGQSMANVAI